MNVPKKKNPYNIYYDDIKNQVVYCIVGDDAYIIPFNIAIY